MCIDGIKQDCDKSTENAKACGRFWPITRADLGQQMKFVY